MPFAQRLINTKHDESHQQHRGPGLHGQSPTDLALQCIKPETLALLGAQPIEADKVCLTKKLFKKG